MCTYAGARGTINAELEPRIKYPGIKLWQNMFCFYCFTLAFQSKIIYKCVKDANIKCGAGEIVVGSSARCVINSICQLLKHPISMLISLRFFNQSMLCSPTKVHLQSCLFSYSNCEIASFRNATHTKVSHSCEFKNF